MAQGQYHCASNIISNSHPFNSKWVDPPIPEIQHFQNLTLKIQGQGHTWGPHSRFNTRSTHIHYVRCRWALAFLSIATKKFDFENPKSRLWLKWTLKVTTWVQHPIDSHPFWSKSIGHPIPEIRLSQNLTLKIQDQGLSWGQSWKLQSGRNIPSTHIPFVPWQSAISFLRYTIFKIWPWKSKAKVMGEGNVESHNMGPTFYRLTSYSFHVNRPSHS